MQNTELFRAGVVLPLTNEANSSLMANDCCPSTPVIYLPIESHALYSKLWILGIFDQINQKCGSLLDEHEEDIVETDHMSHVISCIDTLRGKRNLSSVQSDPAEVFLADLCALAVKSLELKLPLFFIL